MRLNRCLRIQSGDVVALTGGGGKTTTMFRLADELAQKKLRVLMTTTTQLFKGQADQAPAQFIFDPERQAVTEILPQLAGKLDEYGQALLIKPIEPGASKAVGFCPETLDALALNHQIDVIIIEADGARNHSFKAPAAHEPVIPPATTLVVPVVGLDAVGRPLNSETVHRPEQVSRLSGLPMNEPVTEDVIARVLGHPQGGLKNVPSPARVIPLLNKAETPQRITAAQNIAAKLLTCARIDSVTIGSVQNIDRPILEVHHRTAAIILAAGGSTRFGSPKQLARWKSQTFIEQVVDTALAAQTDPVIVVLGAEAERCAAALGDRPVHVVVNEDWADGQSASVRAGLAALPANIGSAVFMLVDQPGVTPDVVDALIERHRQTLAPVARPEFGGKPGNPVLFDRSLFGDLQYLTGDQGGRAVIVSYREGVEHVPVTNPAVLQDFDNPEDLAAVDGC